MTFNLNEIFTSLAKFARLIKGQRADPGPMPIAQAEDALALVTNLHELQLDQMDMHYNSQRHNIPYQIQDLKNLKKEVQNYEDKIDQLRQHGHPVIKDVLTTNDDLNTCQLVKYTTALWAGPDTPQVAGYNVCYRLLAEPNRVVPSRRQTPGDSIFDIPEQTPIGDTGDFERLLNAMQYNTRGATDSRIRIEKEARQQNLPYATDPVERQAAQFNRSKTRLAYNAQAYASQRQRARQTGIQVPEILLKPLRLFKNIGLKVLGFVRRVEQAITNRFSQRQEHQPAQIATRPFSNFYFTRQSKERINQFIDSVKAGRFKQTGSSGSFSSGSAQGQLRLTQSSSLVSAQGQPELPAPELPAPRLPAPGLPARKKGNMRGGGRPHETRNFESFQGEAPIGTPYLPREGTVLVSLGLLGLLVKAGWSSRRRIFGEPLSVSEAKEALRLVTDLHELHLDKLDPEFNSFTSAPNPNIETIRRDLARVQDQLIQLLEHGHSVVRKAVRIQKELNRIQLVEYQTALIFGVDDESVKKYRLQYLALCEKYRITPLNLHQNEPIPECMVTIPDQTPLGDTGNLERLLNAMQFNTRRETLKKKRELHRAQQLYLTSNVEEGIPIFQQYLQEFKEQELD